MRSLEQLLDRLSAADGLTEKLRIVKQSVELVRSLSAHDRERIAMKVGSQWAWRHLEKLLGRDGELDERDELVRDVIEKIGESDPRQLASAARAARRGEFEELERFAIDTARDALQDDAEVPEPPADLDLADVLDVDPETSEAQKPPNLEPELPERALPNPPEPDPPVAPVSASAPPPATPRKQPTLPTVDWDTSREPRPPSVAEAADASTAAKELAAFSTARARLGALRRLREEPRSGAGLGSEGRARLLSRLGAGWPARRAISQLIRDGAFSDLDEALSSIRRLDTPTRRTWCLADLIEHTALDAGDAQRILDAVPSPTARRRLERRLAARAGSDRRGTRSARNRKV